MAMASMTDTKQLLASAPASASSAPTADDFTAACQINREKRRAFYSSIGSVKTFKATSRCARWHSERPRFVVVRAGAGGGRVLVGTSGLADPGKAHPSATPSDEEKLWRTTGCGLELFAEAKATAIGGDGDASAADHAHTSWLFELVAAVADAVAPKLNAVAFDYDDVCSHRAIAPRHWRLPPLPLRELRAVR